MRWTKASRYHAVSDTGYRICWTGRAEDRVFTAWAPETGNDRHESIGYFSGERARELAIDACENHASRDFSVMRSKQPEVARG